MSSSIETRISGRYILHQKLGEGGMGIVYRATDRLTGRSVALKQVTVSGEKLQFVSQDSQDKSDNFRLDLAQEFKTLASLRHPHIISVIDYGFDAKRQPFLTMELLENAPTLIEAGRNQPHEKQIELLVQLLQALAYLHRRGIIHRDLKPDNVLVVDGQVKVLDFGLAVAREHLDENGGDIVGTLAYMAPEVLSGEGISEASDMYAVGVMMYELFAGRHPFDTSSLAGLMQDIYTTEPDLTPLKLDAESQNVVQKLLAKTPADRYGDAHKLINYYAETSHHPELKVETQAIRESYLEAAEFVGRENEIELLTGALTAAQSKQGSAWLVGGESGVGKSRLLEEVRTQALVKGVLVLQGQAINEGSTPYQVWQDVFRRLCLEKELSDLEASVLKTFVPDINRLLERDVPDVPPLAPKEAYRRLLEVMVGFFQQQSQPLLVILEDMQWAGDESVGLLSHLTQSIYDIPLLLLASFRDDERPHLPAVLPFMENMTLARLTPNEVAALSSSMLGPAGEQPDLIKFLQKETEGNTLFIVEVVRSLAEEAGQLGQIVQMRLPQSISAEGIQTVIERRLEQAGSKVQLLLPVAAIAGRQLDLKILRHLAVGVSVENWLNWCTEAGILEVVEDRWQFTHDKLREVVIAKLTDDEQQSLHRQIAETIENVYTADLSPFYARLAYHWSQVDAEQGIHYLLLAGDQTRSLYAHQDAINYYRQALTLLKQQNDYERAARTLMKLGLTYHNAFDFEQSRQAYDEGFALWQKVSQGAATTLSPAPHPLRLAWREPESLDPGLSTYTPSDAIIAQLFSGLVRESPDMEVIPEIAQSWEIRDEGRMYVFHLREDAHWSDGVPVTAMDFEYAWKRMLDPTTGSKKAGLLYDIKGARAFHQGQTSDPDDVGVWAVDEFTLSVELEEPTSYFLHLLAQSDAQPIPQHAVEAHGKFWTSAERIVTNGPFLLDLWLPGELILLARNPAYQGWIAGNVEQVELAFYGGTSDLLSTKLLQAYEANNLDIAGMMPRKMDMSQARHQYAAEYMLAPIQRSTYLGFDTSQPPFDNPQVRRALAMALDRRRMAENVEMGELIPATGGFIPASMPGFSDGLYLRFQPQEAQQLLAEAGFPAGQGFPIIEAATGQGSWEDLAQFLTEQWREILNIEVQWNIMEPAAFFNMLQTDAPSLFISGWVADYADPDNFLRVAPIKQCTRWQNDMYDKWVDEARRITDQEMRMSLYQQADRILIEEAAIVPLAYGRNEWLMKPWVKTYPTSPVSWWFWKDVIIEPH